jgi:hypothetical protein
MKSTLNAGLGLLSWAATLPPSSRNTELLSEHSVNILRVGLSVKLPNRLVGLGASVVMFTSLSHGSKVEKTLSPVSSAPYSKTLVEKKIPGM